MTDRVRRTHLALSRRLPFLLLLLAAPVLTLGCKVDEEKFSSRVFKCDTTAPDPLCGTDADGVPMTCFAARQIGGVDFCTASCGEPMSLPDEGAVCVQGSAKLKFCDPDAADACGRPDLGCLRTDVAAPGDVGEGVCITGNPCLTDDNCRDPVRSRCAATFLKDIYKGAPDLKSDHLYCLQEGCANGGSFCSPGEACLPTVVPQARNAPDICVPKCDSLGRCPPNHFCLREISGPANPAVCIPGLLGFVCGTDVDCLVGKCKIDDADDPNRALHLCTISCTSDDDCARFDGDQGLFVCSAGPDDRHCVTPNAYTGALCRTTDDCNKGHRDKGTVCLRQHPDDEKGTCLYGCDARTPCQPRDGVGHACLPFVDDGGKTAGACLPGLFPYPCFDDSQCAVADLACAGVDLHDPANPVPGHCTRLCATDADCGKNKWTAGQSFCGAPALPVCLPLMVDGEKCEAARQCASKVCETPPEGTAKTCGGKAKP